MEANLILQYERAKTAADSCGFRLVIEHVSSIKLRALPGCHPSYTSEAIFFEANHVSDILCFLQGWRKQLERLKVLGVTNDKKIDRAEELLREKKTLKALTIAK